MNKQVLSLAIATALVVPITTHADIKIYGQIGAEAASVEYAGGDEDLVRGKMGSSLGFTETDDDMGRQILTEDRYGNILNDGPNLIGLDFELDKKLPGGMIPHARYRTTFHTTNNSGLGPGLEAWVGLKNDTFQIKYGKLRGAYRNAKGLIDPWIYTSMQARGTGGGMSGGRYNEVHWNWNATGDRRSVVKDPITGKVGINPGYGINTSGLVHSSDIPGALEMGVKFGGVNARVQIMGDDNADKRGGNVELKYTSPNMTIWAHGAYLDQGDNQISPGGAAWNNDKFTNWKVGANYKVIPGLKLAIQYEDGELGAFDNNPDGGQYIIGSFDYRIQKITLAGWVAGYLSDIEENLRLTDINGEVLDEDALSWSLGAKFHITEYAHIFAGYRQTDSDNDYRDENVFSAGMLYKF
ncbi:MAG: porin [Thiomargarita sp.]|nr:porin [Thiomargarita sp.]